MDNLLHNFGCPPRSIVSFKNVQIKEYILFNPRTLEKILRFCSVFEDNLEVSVEKYVQNNVNFNENNKPDSYMIGELIELNSEQNTFNKILKKYKYEECKDIDLLIKVLCSTVGDIYIPNRKLSYEKTKFNNMILFNKEEVEAWIK